MKKNSQKPIKINKLWPVTVAVLFVMCLWHGREVASGVARSGDVWLIPAYGLLSAAVAAVAGIAAWKAHCTAEQGFCLERFYAFAGLSLGFLFLLVLPPLSGSDEQSHYITAYQLSNHMMGKTANSPDGYVLVRLEDWFLEDVYGDYGVTIEDDGTVRVDPEQTGEVTTLGYPLTQETYHVIYDMGFSHADVASDIARREGIDVSRLNGTAVSAYAPVRTTPLAYVPQALGMTIARLFHLNSLCLLYLGRLMNLLFFVGMVYLALRRLPFGKGVMAGVALLPMTLNLSSSLCYDVTILAGIFYFTAVCLDLAYKKERVTAADVVLLAVLMAVVGPCKMVYSVFLGLCLLIPIKKFGGFGRWALSAAAVLAVLVTAVLAVNHQMIAVYATETESYVQWAAEEGYTLSYLFHNPGQALQIFYNTFVWQAEYYHLTMLGSYLGNLDVMLEVPYVLLLFFTSALMLLSFRTPEESIMITGARRVWIWILCIACAGALMLSMLIAWTPVSSVIISGVQGRYFLPFLPILLMSIKNDFVVLTKNADRSILYLMCCADACVLVRLFAIVSMRG